MDANGLTRAFFKLDASEWHGLQTESLWAEPILGGKGDDAFVVRNSPFYTGEVSYLDVIRAVPGIHKRGLDYAGLIDSSGHSTYRLIVQEDRSNFAKYWQALEQLGCTYESGRVKQGLLYSVDVPSMTDIYEVHEILEEGQKNHVWIFEEGHIGHPLK